MADATGHLATCPHWCVTAHDPSGGEDDWLHQSEPVLVHDGVTARLCMSVDPATGERDGPYVIVGEDQLSPDEAQRLCLELTALASLAQAPSGPGAAA